MVAHFILFSGSSMLYCVPSVDAYEASVASASGFASDESAAAPISKALCAPAWRSVWADRIAVKIVRKIEKRFTAAVYHFTADFLPLSYSATNCFAIFSATSALAP